MDVRILALLALLGILLLAGCSFKSNSNDDGSDTTFSAGSTDDDDKDSPGASIGAVLSVLGAALAVRRRRGGSGAA